MTVRKPPDAADKVGKKERNGILYALFWHMSLVLVGFFKKIKATPNQVSVLSFLCYGVCGICFYFGGHTINILGAIIFAVGVLLDCTDGKLARAIHKASDLGIWLDYNFDYIKYPFVYIPLTLALYRQTADVRIFIYGFVIVTCILTYVIVTQRYAEFPFAQQEQKRITQTKIHLLAKQLYAYEIIEAVLLLFFASISNLYLFLKIWAFYFALYYLATTIFLGYTIYKNDFKKT